MTEGWPLPQRAAPCSYELTFTFLFLYTGPVPGARWSFKEIGLIKCYLVQRLGSLTLFRERPRLRHTTNNETTTIIHNRLVSLLNPVLQDRKERKKMERSNCRPTLPCCEGFFNPNSLECPARFDSFELKEIGRAHV